MDIAEITKKLSGKRISHLTMPEAGHLAIHFVDGSALLIQRRREGLAIDFAADTRTSKCPAAREPSPRQREYLEFIKKYMARFGISPAESDIQRHFLVSAPSVNQMAQALERHGFITRQTRKARSMRLVDATECALCGRTHLLKVRVPQS